MHRTDLRQTSIFMSVCEREIEREREKFGIRGGEGFAMVLDLVIW